MGDVKEEKKRKEKDRQPDVIVSKAALISLPPSLLKRGFKGIRPSSYPKLCPLVNLVLFHHHLPIPLTLSLYVRKDVQDSFGSFQ